MSLLNVSSQTAGPYLAIGFSWLHDGEIAPAGTPGQRVTVEGRLLDGDGVGINDGAVEVWQADASGRYVSDAGAAFRGFGRVLTDDEGRFRFSTIKPGRVPDAGGAMQAPHLAVTVFMRGSLRQVSSRVYFPGDPANTDDPVLALVPAARRATLIARPTAGDASRLAWDIHLQGEHETVFFDF
jgi:protocatechuate 3,4-dioxygenase, alpha subunit